MKLLVIAALFLPICAVGDQRIMPALTQDKLVGSWEAVVQDRSMASGVYRMEFAADGSGYFVHVWDGPGGPRAFYIARLTECEVRDGNIRARFAPPPHQVPYHDWIEVQGSAVAEEDRGAIVGTLIMHKDNSLAPDATEPVKFKKGSWMDALERAAKTAEEAIKDERACQKP